MILPPIGAVRASTGLTFSLAPMNPTALPYRLRCTSCPWQMTVTGGTDDIRAQADQHAHTHGDHSAPHLAHLPSWLQFRNGDQ